MSDITIMKKVIIQIYNNLQVLWSSKVKFVSLCFWDAPSLGPTLVFSQFQVSLSHLWVLKKKKKNRRKKTYKGRERRSRTRKQERE